MKKLFKSYKGTILLLLGVLIGAICGIVFQSDAVVVKPLGDLFLNLLLISIVPLIFFSISSSIAKMKEKKRLSKILISTFVIFLITSIVAVVVGFVAIKPINLVDVQDNEIIGSLFSTTEEETVELNLLERTVEALSTDEFVNLFSTEHLIALIVVSMLFGIAVNKTGEKGKIMTDFLDSGSEVMYKFVEIISYYAPIGLGCYMASLVGTLGETIAVGFLKVTIVYFLVSILFMFVFYTLYAYLSFGKLGVKAYWKNILPPAFTSLGTCSSAACVPVNIKATKKMGVPSDIAEATISLGTSFHKDGSAIGSVFKIMFLVCFFGTSLNSFWSIGQVLGVSLIATLLVTAVPIGGGTISEMLILTLMGYPVAALPILTIIATVIDAPATLLNVVGDSSCALMVTRVVEGRQGLKVKKN
ncbi:TPA: dicarboxylate/amino acid:cation symporter [Candidatus Ventrenecus avicola]|nr:dicarboxylate/amino acid:cation symporter [Candidatus Ventrenecus avicola]